MTASAIRMTTSGSLSNERLGDIVDHNGVSSSFDHSPDEHAEAIEHLEFAINEFRVSRSMSTQRTESSRPDASSIDRSCKQTNAAKATPSSHST